MKKWKKGLQKGWPACTAAILLLMCWEWGIRLDWISVPSYILPMPSEIGVTFVQDFGTLMEKTGNTVKRVLIGFAIGSGIGITTAVLMHLIPFTHRLLYPYLIVSQNIPIIALAPLLAIWFGFNQAPHLIIITLVCFFPVAISGLSGFAQTDRMMLSYMRMSGASRWQFFTKLEFPYGLPSLFSGLKISSTYSVMGAVFAEWSAAGRQQGIAAYMKISQSGFQVDRVFVCFFIIVLLSLLMISLIKGIEAVTLKWKHSEPNV
ncbi:ABC transporter permease [Marinicrinis sediminis]|uniref:ABC transporter permease n=1 Tax=Marinicrinis sediminis TaxID=1652465 RepID=A0ABW5R871_9BACL